jgi:hypothetical protein
MVGMETQGIFRLEGNAQSISTLREQMESGDYEFDRMESPNNVAGLLKQWLRSLTVPPLVDLKGVLAIAEFEGEQQYQRAEALLSSLSEAHFELVAAILELLHISMAIASHKHQIPRIRP